MDGKKISFGFKPKLKPGNLISPSIVKKPDQELIECLEGSSIKIIGKKEEKPKLLVIPLKSDNNATKRIANTALKIIKEEQGIDVAEDDVAKPVDSAKPDEPCNETLDQKAAREIIASITQIEVADETKIYSLPVNPDELPLDGASESTIDDYENIPIRDFGLAMLRGMGWKDEEKKANELKLPPLRPKGMGLGADKLAKPKELLVQPAHNEVLEIKKNAYVKVITGKHKNLYGQIEGLDDDNGRINIVLTIGGLKISLNEFTVQVVTKEEWIKYGKILNSTQYDEYKNKDVKFEIKKEKAVKSEPPPTSSSNNNKSSDLELERHADSKNNRSSKNSSSLNENSSRRNYSDNDENDSKTSSSYDKRKQNSSRSTSSSKYYQHKSRRASSGSSEDSDSEEERRGNEKQKKSSKSSKSSHDRNNRSRSRSRERHRKYSSEESSDDQKYHHKKKTKKSKKPRSRSRTRR